MGCCLLGFVMPLAAQNAVSYQERSWDPDKKQVVTTQKTCTNYTVITGRYNDWCNLGTGWFVMRGSVQRKVFHIYGDVHLILEDGCEMNAQQVKVEQDGANNFKLYIHSQSDGDKQGRMVIENTTHAYRYDAVIGSARENMGSLYIHGGDITAIQGQSTWGAVIGGGSERNISNNSEIVIYGGKVKAYVRDNVMSYGAAIGGGCGRDQGGPVTIYGGQVEAYSTQAAIGGGFAGAGGTVNIYGGKVIAGKCPAAVNCKSAAIGGSQSNEKGVGGEGGDVHIYGGEVYAYASNGSSAIGSAYDKFGGSLEMTGGMLYANGAYNPAKKTTFTTAPAIGSGRWGNGINLKITGGTIKAVTKHITYVDTKKTEQHILPAPIGTSNTLYDTQIYNTGQIELGQVKMSYSKHNEAADDEQYQQGEYLHPITGEQRLTSLDDNTITYMQIEPCTHADYSYVSKDNEYHTSKCKYCEHATEQKHDFDPSTHKCVCGYTDNSPFEFLHVIVYTTTDGKTYTSDDYMVFPGMEMSLPSPSDIKGLKFMGYLPNPATAPTDIEMKDSELNDKQLLSAGTNISPDKKLVYYARYRYNYTEKWVWNDKCTEATLTLSNPLLSDVQLQGTVTEDEGARIEATETTQGEAHFLSTVTYQKATGVTYSFEDHNKLIFYPSPIVIIDAMDTEEEIASLLNANHGNKVQLTINNLTLKKDGKLHPLSLPFDCKVSDTPLSGATIYRFSGYELNANNLSMQFETTTEIEAGEPYFYCFPSGTDVTHPIFSNVAIDYSGGSYSNQYFELISTYGPFAPADEELNYVFVLDNDELAKVSSAISGFSNYFYIPATLNEDGSRAVSTVTLYLESETQITKRLCYSWAGDGTEATPYIIKSAEQLKELSEAFNTDNSVVEGKYFRQAANITFDKDQENNFMPISSFKGYYDGAGYTISGLNVNLTKQILNAQTSALIQELKGGYVKNVIIQNSTFIGSNAAAIAATVQNATIENCHALKDVYIQATSLRAGGITASVKNSNAVVKGCSSQAQVQGYNGVGGIAGYVDGGGIITNSFYLGSSVTALNGSSNAVACYNQQPESSAKENIFYTDTKLQDQYASLMPDRNKDNTDFLTLLHERDQFLLNENSGLTKEQIGYDITLNNRTMKATQKTDGTWERWTFSVCLPFDLDLAKLDNAEHLKVYRLHEVDVENKVLQFTNEFPLLQAGMPYLVTVEKGEVPLTAKNVLVAATPQEPIAINTADGSKQIGWWCGTFRRIENAKLGEDNIYLIQSKKRFICPVNGYFKQYAYPFIAYFKPLESLGFDIFQSKFIRTENGEESGGVEDFPTDEFESDSDDTTGISPVIQTIDADGTSRYYDLQGRPLNGKPARGLYIHNGKKTIVR